VDVADLIDSFGTGTYTVTRRPAPTLVNGRAVPGVPATFDITASVQPASGRDLLRLPEGQRSIETCVLFTATQLLVAVEGSGNISDVVEIDGRKWEIQNVARWDNPANASAPYWKCIAQAAT
jgi:hypothetical protein